MASEFKGMCLSIEASRGHSSPRFRLSHHEGAGN